MKDKNPKNEKKKQLSNPHDLTFKKLFSQIEIATDVIIKNLPSEILNIIDVNNMKLVNKSYIDDNLKESFADVVYETKINGTSTYVTLLLEHKSYTDKMTIFQVLTYIIGIWRQAIADGKNELPIVLPIVLSFFMPCSPRQYKLQSNLHVPACRYYYTMVKTNGIIRQT